MGDQSIAGSSTSDDVAAGFRREPNSAKGGSGGDSACGGAKGEFAATKRQRGPGGAFCAKPSEADAIITASACDICTDSLEPRDRASFWGSKPSRIGEPWDAFLAMTLYQCAKRTKEALYFRFAKPFIGRYAPCHEGFV